MTTDETLANWSRSPVRASRTWLTQELPWLPGGCWCSELPQTSFPRKPLPIAMKISFTFIAVFADVSMNSKLLSSAYVCAS